MSATDQQWEFILEKYDGLMWKIAHNISGDNAISALEDNYQDLCVTALNAIRGFEKKTGEKPEDFLDTVMFNKYIKTCLWNLKANKGANITKKYPLTKRVMSMFGNTEALKVEGKTLETTTENEIFIKEISSVLSKVEQEVLNVLVDDPGLLKPSGTVNISKLSRVINKSWAETQRIVKALSDIIGGEL